MEISFSSTATFKHDHLSDAENEVRLLKVVDVDFSDTIKVVCRMTTWAMDSTPSYHAISYTWGDEKSNTTIIINNKPFQVRTNCEFVLKQAHWNAKNRYYWIDAICIDQENLGEKSKQVAMMGDIYRRAALVLACVGEHTGDSLFLFRNFEQFSSIVRNSQPDAKSFLSILSKKLGILDTRRWLRASIDLATRPYFTRLWTLQELKSARKASLMCGQGAVSKDEFVAILDRLLYYISRLLHKPIREPSPLLYILRPDATKKRQILQKSPEGYMIDAQSALATLSDFLSKEVNPLHLVSITTQLQCKLRKDKVYGIISLLDSGDGALIIPDYTKPDFEVAVDLLRAVWKTEFVQKKDSGLGLLTLCLDTIKNLRIYWRTSDSVHKALKARRGNPTRPSKDAQIGLKDPPPRARIMATGWRVSARDLIRDSAGFKYWNPPRLNIYKFYLPNWTKGGDWVLYWKDATWERTFLVLREEADGFSIVGHGWCASFGPVILPDTTFEVHWNPEDALIFTMIRYLLDDGEKPSRTWLRKLHTGVCRRETPGSSYAVKVLH